MFMHDDPHDAPEQAGSTTSYVYPVRSLLSGIQPASEQKASSAKPDGNAPRHEAFTDHRRSMGIVIIPKDASSSSPSPGSRHSDRDTGGHTLFSSKHGHGHSRRKRSTPNFCDLSADDNPFSPRTFSTALESFPADSFVTSPSTADMLFTAGSTGELVMCLSARSDPTVDEDSGDDLDPRHPPHFAGVAAERFADVTSALGLISDTARAESEPSVSSVTEDTYGNQAPSNFSQMGIVHLPPLETPLPLFQPRGSMSASSSARGRANGNILAVQTEVVQGEVEVVQLPSTDMSRSFSPPSVTGSGSLCGSSSSISGTSDSEEPLVTFRYQHVEEEHGHHLIVGREGMLTTCEDEPIRTPGAVQGFGILMAVEEDEETGNLVVRQVSENSTELLGLSPQYLFSLDCFSQTLPDPQGDVLFDNIQYLSDTSLTAEEQAENMHVFMLSGWGEPGSALLEDMNGDPQGRRSWNCWCAAHRPQMSGLNSTAGNGGSTAASSTGQDYNIIILEFELEKDSFNPLYPSIIRPEDSSVRSGVSSPSDASGSASNSSGRTLVSTSSEGDILPTPEGFPSLVNSNGSANVTATSSALSSQSSRAFNLPGRDDWLPSPEDILESTTSRSKPLLALERLRRTRRLIPESPSSPASFGSGSRTRGNYRRRRGTGAVGMMDVFAVMAQINEQLGAAPDLESFLKVTAGVVKDLTQFHRVLVYQFDEAWNGQVVAELVDWNQTHDLFKGLHFPAADIPAQARDLYALNKVRLLYDRGQPTARLVVRSKDDLKRPLDMTHCYLRAMSPIHLKYLENMGVRASMSVSIIAFGMLWGLVACHSYGSHGMRVSFPVRQMLRLLSQSISRNIERLSYAQRLHTRKLINTMPSDQHPSGYIVSNADDLLGLFDADYGVLVIGEGAKILGPNQHGQEILIVAEYLRLKQFNTLQVSQAVTADYPDLQLTTGLEVIAGLLYVPLSVGGRDFIAFLRKGQPRLVKWAGRPYKDSEDRNVLEPRNSFKTWSETVAGRCRAWSDEHLETAGVLALVYGKFIEVWRQKESALQTTKLTNILLSNASHEVRTPLNHIINYLELAMNGPLDTETRENLSQSHAASKSLLFTINDLLDLTRLESGNETSFNEPFDLHQAIDDATLLYRNEAARRGLEFKLDLSKCPRLVVGDSRKIRTVVANLTANALKYTSRGFISVACHAFEEPVGLRTEGNIAVEIVVADSGCGIPIDKLESIFREFEQVETTSPRTHSPGLGLGLAVVARIVEQLGGQLRVDSKLNEGSRFSFLLPFSTDANGTCHSPTPTSSSRSSLLRSRANSHGSRGSELNNLVEALSSNHMGNNQAIGRSSRSRSDAAHTTNSPEGKVDIPGSCAPIRPVKVDEFDLDPPISKKPARSRALPGKRSLGPNPADLHAAKLRILIVEDNDINRTILAKRLALDGHIVVNTTNGQEGIEMIESDREFDCVLMDIQMPIINGYEATERIRAVEQKVNVRDRVSHKINGRIPIFAVSASLVERQRDDLHALGMDGWILKPIDFKRLRVILRGVTDPVQREKDIYQPGCSWEIGGWFSRPSHALECAP